MNESDAKAALRAQGIRNPSRQLVRDWLRTQQSQEWALDLDSAQESQPQQQTERGADSPNPTQPEGPERHPSSESNLEPLLRERGELERPAGRRKAGRPRILAPWFEALSRTMADGTCLREALSICGIHGLSERQIRSLYRNRTFQALYREARRKWWSEFGVRPRRRTVRPKGCQGEDCLGASLRRMLRTL
jgi:hypothetical protein